MARPGFRLTARFVEYRISLGLTQATLAEEAKTSQQVISRLERGLEQMSYRRAMRVLEAVGVSVQDGVARGLVASPNGQGGQR